MKYTGKDENKQRQLAIGKRHIFDNYSLAGTSIGAVWGTGTDLCCHRNRSKTPQGSEWQQTTKFWLGNHIPEKVAKNQRQKKVGRFVKGGWEGRNKETGEEGLCVVHQDRN